MPSAFYHTNFENIAYYSDHKNDYNIQDEYLNLAGFKKMNDSTYRASSEEWMVISKYRSTDSTNYYIAYYLPAEVSLDQFKKRLTSDGFKLMTGTSIYFKSAEPNQRFEIISNIIYDDKSFHKILFIERIPDPSLSIKDNTIKILKNYPNYYPFQNTIWRYDIINNEVMHLSRINKADASTPYIYFIDDKNFKINIKQGTKFVSYGGTYKPLIYTDKRSYTNIINLQPIFGNPNFKLSIKQHTLSTNKIKDVLETLLGLEAQIYDDGIILNPFRPQPASQPSR